MNRLSNTINTYNRGNTRNSSFELLRIISMIMIIFHHISLHGEIICPKIISIPYFWNNLIIMGGKLGSNIFVLISGYFLINDNRQYSNVKKLLKLWGQIIFYSLIIEVLFVLFGKNDFSLEALIKAMLPIIYNKWWFASTYFVLMIIYPFLNKLLTGLNKTTYQHLIIIIVACWSIIPTIFNRPFECNNLLWFITLYSIAGYIRLYGANPKLKAGHYLFLSVFMTAVTYILIIAPEILASKWSFFGKYCMFFMMQNVINILILSVCIFMFFSKISFQKRIINMIASTTFGIYLIHDNSSVREFLLKDIFNVNQYQNSNNLVLYTVFVAAVIFCGCAALDYVRSSTVEKLYFKLIDKYFDLFVSKLKSFVNMLEKHIFG